MNKFKIANVKEGKDLMKLSFIFNLTAKPASINKNNPTEANSNIIRYK